MIKSLRTYRSLRVIVAFAAMLSIGLPLVRHACAMTGLTVTTPSHLASLPCPEHTDSAMRDMGMCGTEAAAPCADDGACSTTEGCSTNAAGDEDISCCKLETAEAEKASATESKLLISKIALPVTAILTNLEASIGPRLSFSKRESSLTKGRGVPIRVLHASFLI